MKLEIPFTHEEQTGFISVEPKDSKTLDDFCRKQVFGSESDRFETIAIRLFEGDEIVTVYALDKKENFTNEKLPVKKFGLEFVSAEELLNFFKEFNSSDFANNYKLQYKLENMEVVNIPKTRMKGAARNFSGFNLRSIFSF